MEETVEMEEMEEMGTQFNDMRSDYTLLGSDGNSNNSNLISDSSERNMECHLYLSCRDLLP